MPIPVAYQRLREERLLAVIRAPNPNAALEAALAVAAGGITILEVTFTVPDAVNVMRELAKRDGLTVGAGTVLTADQARAAFDAGARFLVAPNLSVNVGAIARQAGIMFCPGAYTTGEILAARDAGADVIKVYPVGVAGGPPYIQVIRDPLPDVPMLAAGGTTLENFVPFLKAGCVGVGLGASLADPKLAAAGNFKEITSRAKTFCTRLREARTIGLVPALS
jgi:2-dehydro-3-deoxyphosphogluconate aldolase/(4S)-4-hydroxy-2-oxoglutarate aldolase